MIAKSFRLSNGFWHKFFPNSNKLFSPQNIPLEIWDIDKRVKENKWKPEIYCIRNLVFSNNGGQFAIRGGCTHGESQFKIYESDTLNCIGEFVLMEECTNPKFTNDDKNLIFGTQKGNIYDYSLKEKTLEKLFSLENTIFWLIHHGKHNNKLYINTSKRTDKGTEYNDDFILEYDILEKQGNKINLEEKIKPCLFSGLALYNNKLAIFNRRALKSETDFQIAEVYAYNIETKKVIYKKEKFNTRNRPIDLNNCIVWNNRGDKLAFIGLKEIYVIDIDNNNEQVLPFDQPSSVEFSNCDTGIAIGGDKASLLKIE